MRVIAIANHKGGTGKTALSLNIASLLASEFGRKVLMIDIDPQASLTESLSGVVEEGNMADVIGDSNPGTVTLNEIIRQFGENLYLAPADIRMADNELGLVLRYGRENILTNALNTINKDFFDIVIMDCPPSLNVLTLNALLACDGVIIPTQPAATDLRGTRLFLQSIEGVRRGLESEIEIIGVVSTFHNKRYIHHQEAIEVLESLGLPVWETIGRTVKIQEAMIDGTPLHEYDPNNPQVDSYRRIATRVDQWLNQTKLENR